MRRALQLALILGLNAANAYGFDVAALAPIAERIGPTLSAVRGH